MSVLNISTYKFVTLNDRESLRERLQRQCDALGLKGTILLAPEGINIFLAGADASIHGFLDWLHGDARFADIQPKESWSGSVPFRKMRVRLKKEIITMKVAHIRPEDHRAETVSPARLKDWLDRGHDDAGREVVMIRHAQRLRGRGRQLRQRPGFRHRAFSGRLVKPRPPPSVGTQ